MIKVINEEYPYNNKQYVMNVDGINSTGISSGIPDCYVHAYNADYGYDYVLCGYNKGTRIVSNPDNTTEYELIYLIPYDIAKKFSDILNKTNYMELDWVVDEY